LPKLWVQTSASCHHAFSWPFCLSLCNLYILLHSDQAMRSLCFAAVLVPKSACCKIICQPVPLVVYITVTFTLLTLVPSSSLNYPVSAYGMPKTAEESLKCLTLPMGIFGDLLPFMPALQSWPLPPVPSTEWLFLYEGHLCLAYDQPALNRDHLLSPTLDIIECSLLLLIHLQRLWE
jgi:hypothetical protein